VAEEIEQLRRDLMELQSQLAFQEDTVQSLNDAMAAQQQEILTLRRQLELLKQRQDEQAVRHETDGAVGPQDEKPPHY
jgi:SlyX protein